MHLIAEQVQPTGVAGEPIVGVVAAQLPHELCVLPCDRSMPVTLEPLRGAAECTAKSVTGRLSSQHPTPIPRLSPVVGEAKQVKTPWPPGAQRLTPLEPSGGSRETDQASLLRVKLQTIAREPLRKDFQYLARIALLREDEPSALNHFAIVFEGRLSR